MKKRLFKYTDFLTESKIEMLLEAKIQFTDDFINVLDRMDNVSADKLLNLIDKDIDVNTNFIDINIEKDGIVDFIPDDKLEKLPWIISPESRSVFTNLASGIYTKSTVKSPESNQIVIIDEEFKSLEDFLNMLTTASTTPSTTIVSYFTNLYKGGDKMLKIKFDTEDGTFTNLCTKSSLVKNKSSITRNQVKVGKLVRSMFTKANIDFKPTDIEDFVNKYKSIITQMRDKFNNFKIVKGEDIRKSYLGTSYLNDSGSLGNSCMRYEKCQKFLDIYVENEDKVQLIVLTKEEKVAGRAILWTDSNNQKVMDRIYTNNSADEQLFKDFASSNNFLYKNEQNMSSDVPFIKPDGSEDHMITIELKVKDYNYYPYMDSFKYYNPTTGEITNDSDNDGEEGIYTLEDTDGGNGHCDECGGGGTMECGDCDGEGEVSCSNCDGDGEVRCSNCSGEGTFDCGECEGSGDIECNSCDGSGKGDDDEDCEDCSGRGTVYCDYCAGNGNIDCDECGGDGNEECGECYGNGNEECYNCDGNGRVDCYQCS